MQRIINNKIVLFNDDMENDDWMKQLPGYQHEVEIHADLAVEASILEEKDKERGK